MLGIGRGGQHGVVAVGVEAKHDLAAWWSFDSQSLCADGHTAIGTDVQGSAHAPHIMPPRAVRCRTQCGALFLAGLIPGMLWSLAQFPMDFLGVVMRPQGVNVRIGHLDFGDFFAGEIGRQPALPELVFAFDFAFGLRRGGVAQADVVELERPAQLGEGVGIVGEKEAVIINVELEGPPVGQKGGGQEVEVGQQQFALVEFGAGEEAATVVEHIEHGKGDVRGWEPAVGRGIQLPEFADALALPAAHRGPNFFGRDGVGQMVLEGPAADLGAVELEVVEAEGFGGDKAVGAGRRAVQAFVEEVQNGLGPGRGVVAAGAAGEPERPLFFGAGAEVSGGERVEAAGRDAELVGGLGGRQMVLPKRVEHIADKGGCVTMDELLMLFKGEQATRRLVRIPSFRRASLRSPSFKTGCGQGDSCFANYKTCPVLLAPRQAEKKYEEAEVYRTERFFGKFQRTVTLPAPVAADKVKAQYKDGVLTVTLPKTEAAKPKQIDVNVN